MTTLAFQTALRETPHGVFFSVSVTTDEVKDFVLVQAPFPYETRAQAAEAAQRHIQLFSDHPLVAALPRSTTRLEGLTDPDKLMIEVVFVESNSAPDTYVVELVVSYDGVPVLTRTSVAPLPAAQLSPVVDKGLGVLRHQLEAEAVGLAPLPPVWEPEVKFSGPAKLRDALPSLFGEG